MRLILFFILLFPISSFGQFKLEEKKGRFGVSVAGDFVFKPKADSVFISDSIATIYKKKKIFYLNQRGDKVYKVKLENGQAFKNDFAIVKNKEGKYGAINAQGEEVIALFLDGPPKYYGNLLLVDSYSYGHSVLYANDGRFMDKIKEVYWLHGWVVVEQQTRTVYYETKKRLFRKNIKKKKYRTNNFQYVLDPYTKEFLVSKGSYQDYGDYVLLTNDKKNDLYSAEGDRVFENISDFKEFDRDYLQFSSDGETILFDRSKGKSLVKGDFIDFRINPSSIYAIKDTSRGILDISIYDHKGELIKDELAFVRSLDRQRFVFMVDTLQYIGTETGEELSEKYAAFGEMANGYRLVYFGASYGYINDHTYRLLPIEYPLIAKHYSGGGSGRRIGGFFRAIGNMIGSFARMMTFQKPPDYSSSGNSGTYNYTSLSESGHPFNNGLAKVCLSGKNKENNYDSLMVVESYEKLYYNFIDTNGVRLNKIKYEQASDFINGKAWVKDYKYYYVINTKGKKTSKYKYRIWKEMESGYFKAQYRGLDYFFSPDLNEVAKCDCFRTYETAEGIFNIHQDDTTLIYAFPKE
jgi:hypothetical protein